MLKVITALPDLAAKELKRSGKFTIPGLALIKTRKKAATPAGKRTMFGKVTVVKAKPANTFPIRSTPCTLQTENYLAMRWKHNDVDAPVL